MVGCTAVLALLAALPSVWPGRFAALNGLKVDTDPENMLPADEPVRVFHDRMKRIMSLHDMIVVGVVNEEHPEGVFNPGSLEKIYRLSQFATGLRWRDKDDPARWRGVLEKDMIAPSMVDNVESQGPGEIRFEWLMPRPPQTQAEALELRKKALAIPFLNDTLVSSDGKAIALYLPVSDKDVSNRIYRALKRQIDDMSAPSDSERYHITGLPVAEDTFGVQMFKQMAVSAPLAMLVIFVLMRLFFKKAVLILPAVYDAVIATIATMALLVITGNTVHIMSSMIPIFIVPIAVLDDVHIISEFYDRYRKTGSRKQTIRDLMGSLFTPMLYTTLTTAVGFASLALAPIPPVQVFGLFVAFGVMVAWLCSILLVPAFISVLPKKVLEGFGPPKAGDAPVRSTLLGRMLHAAGRFTCRYAKVIVALSAAALVLSGYGISLIRVNDNPIKWFAGGHPIRVADKVLNRHFGGTYMVYLALRPQDAGDLPQDVRQPAAGDKRPAAEPGGDSPGSGPALPGGLGGPSQPGGAKAASAGRDSVGSPPEVSAPEIFKQPETLRWVGSLQDYIEKNLGGYVGKSNSVTDIVKTVHRELMQDVERNGRVITEQEAFRVPDSRGGIAQCLLQFQNSHRPQDLWHFVTPGYDTGVLWLQLTSGDNRDTTVVTRAVEAWLDFWQAGNEEAAAMVRRDPQRFKPVMKHIAGGLTAAGMLSEDIIDRIDRDPAGTAKALKAAMDPLAPGHKLRGEWFGLTYINVVWQEKMVLGMLKAFLGSFIAVFLMMTLLYRSALWGILCMAPLTVTIAMIYGLIGLFGKDYDMPVAVLSSLSLGLAVDYAIHFLTRSRMMYIEYGSWEKTAGPVFGEPARAISRNAIVVGVGFLPLLFGQLVPYHTVGVLIAAILFLAGVSSLLILPAAVTLLERRLFPRTRAACVLCNRVTCMVSAAAAVLLVAVNVQQFLQLRWTMLTWFSIPAVAVLAGMCGWAGRGERARTETFAAADKTEE